MHKNANNSMIIESNQSITHKKNYVSGMQTGFNNAPKVGNFVGGFATNSSVISNNMSVDKNFDSGNH